MTIAGVLVATTLLWLSSGHAAASNPVTVTGIVFHDENGNGRREASEQGLPGFQVGIYRAGELGLPPHTVTTDSTGRFTLIVDYTERVAAAVRLVIVAEPTSHPAGYVWNTTAVSNPIPPLPGSNEVGPLAPGAAFDIVFGKRLEQGTPPPTPQVPGQVSTEELLRTTPPPQGGPSAGVSRLPSTGSGASRSRATPGVLVGGVLIALGSGGMLSAMRPRALRSSARRRRRSRA